MSETESTPIVRELTPAELEAIQLERPDFEVQLQSLSQWQLAWRRFKRHRLAMVGAVLFLGMCAVAIVGPILLRTTSTSFPRPTGSSTRDVPRRWRIRSARRAACSATC